MANKEITLNETVKHLLAAQLLISGKWKLSILIAIADGIGRFRDLQRSLLPVTTRSLSQELKAMESDGLVVRIVENAGPVSLVIYSLSDSGKALLPITDELIKWSKYQASCQKQTFIAY